MRSSALENLAAGLRAYRAGKGCVDRSGSLFRHLLRNALGPIVTLLGLSLPFVLAGTLIIEQVFNFPGDGPAVLQLGADPDYPVLLGVIVVVGAGDRARDRCSPTSATGSSTRG